MLSPKGNFVKGNFVTLADFNLLKAARPVLVASALKAAQADLDRKIEARQREIAARRESLVVICASGRVIRPIK